MLGWEVPLDAVKDRRRQAQIPTSVIVRSVAVMFLSRLGSLNALEQSRPSRFWQKWLNHTLPSADTVGRVCALVEPGDLRSLHHHLYSRLKRMKVLEPPAHPDVRRESPRSWTVMNRTLHFAATVPDAWNG